MQRNGGSPLIVQHNYQRVIPSTSDPDGDVVAQAPMAPPVAAPPAAVSPSQVVPDTVQSTQPSTGTPNSNTTQPYTAPKVDTIDANTPPSSPKTTASTDEPSTPAAPDTAAKFDANGVATLTKDMHKNGYHDKDPALIVVDKGAHFTYVLQNQNNRIVIVYRASNAVGKADTPSPPGPYKVADIQKYPVWTPPKSIRKDQKPVKPYNVDSHNPLGVEIIRLNKFGVALHGTNDPTSIRSDASHGCVRHSNDDILKIASMVRVGTTVIITDKFVGTKISKDMFGKR
jgi:lipoprotein-anchoring transpeptidase ErfK/SrfK